MRTIKAAVKRKYQRLVLWLFRQVFCRENLRPAYAQFGEDQVLDELVGTQTHGFYVDVGAHHPHRLSNTHLLYLRGWWGINVDPNRAAIDAFEIERPSDVNLCCAVGTTGGTARLYAYDEPALNTLSDARAAVVGPAAHEILVPVRTLNDILAEHLPPRQSIDLLSIDVEGLDLAILQSLDFEHYRPRLICVEMHDLDFERLADEPVYRLLRSHGYRMVSVCLLTGIFRLESAVQSDSKGGAAA